MNSHETPRRPRRPTGWLLLAVCAGLLPACSSPVDPVLEQAFDEALPGTSIAVYPVMLRSGSASSKFDVQLAESLAERLRADGIAVQVVDEQAPLHGEPGFNQAALFRENAAAFGKYILQRPSQSKPCDYSLQPELLVDRNGAPIGVHAYIVTRDGKLAGGLLLNSHHQAFQSVNPRTPADGLKVLLSAFREEYLEQAPAGPPASAPAAGST